MPSIQTASIPVTSFPNEFVSPWGNDEVIPLYSSVPLRSPVEGCLPCVVCGSSPIRDQIVANVGGLRGAGFGSGGGSGGGGGGSGGGGGGDVEVIITLNEFSFSADFIVLRYLFTDGRDLDTRTKLISPEVGSYVGWCMNGSFTGSNNLIWYEWSGDNTGTGYESVLINVSNIRSAHPTLDISGECFGLWYGERESGNVTISLTAYLGGTMERVGFDFINVGGQQTADITKATNSSANQSACIMGDFLTNFTYKASNRLVWE